jgi:hypothetical protein
VALEGKPRQEGAQLHIQGKRQQITPRVPGPQNTTVSLLAPPPQCVYLQSDPINAPNQPQSEHTHTCFNVQIHLHKHFYTCACLHTLFMPDSETPHPVPAAGQFPLSLHIWENKSQCISLYHLPLQGKGLLLPLLCLGFGFQGRQIVNTAPLKP